MKRLNVLVSELLVLSVLAACQAGGVAPTEAASPTARSETPALAGGTPTPPDAPETRPSPTEQPHDVITAYGGPVSPEQQAYLDGEEYQARKAILNKHFDRWAAPGCGVFNSESVLVEELPIPSIDGNTFAPAIRAKMDDGNWHIYVPPFGVYSPPASDLCPTGPGEGPLELTGGNGDLRWDPQASRFLRYDSQSKRVTDTLSLGGDWETVKTFPIATTRAEASSCRVTGSDLKGPFQAFARSVDTSPFPLDVVVSPIRVQSPPAPNTTFLTWQGDQAGNQAVYDLYTKNPSLLPFRNVLYCVVSYSELVQGGADIDMMVRVVKFLDSSNKVSYVALISRTTETEDPGDVSFPSIVVSGNGGVYDYLDGGAEARANVLNLWASEENAPDDVERMWFYEMKMY